MNTDKGFYMERFISIGNDFPSPSPVGAGSTFSVSNSIGSVEGMLFTITNISAFLFLRLEDYLYLETATNLYHTYLHNLGT